MTWQANKVDYLTRAEIDGIVRQGTDPRMWVFKRIAEVIINPMDIRDLDDEGKAIPYNPDQFDKANPSFFMDEYWFSFLTEYPDTSQPVSVKHFLKQPAP